MSRMDRALSFANLWKPCCASPVGERSLGSVPLRRGLATGLVVVLLAVAVSCQDAETLRRQQAEALKRTCASYVRREQPTDHSLQEWVDRLPAERFAVGARAGSQESAVNLLRVYCVPSS